MPLTAEQRSANARKAGRAGAGVKRHRDSARSVLSEELAARGSACERCGNGSYLVWHHRRPSTKSFTICEARKKSAGAMRTELAKCELLCRGCHEDEHAGAPARMAAELGVSLEVLLEAADRAGVAWQWARGA